MSLLFIEIIIYLFNYIVYIIEDIIIRKTDYMISHLFEILFSKHIVGLLSWFGMISAIHLNDESAFT